MPQFIICGLLIPTPMARCCMLSHIACTAEKDMIIAQKLGICLRVLLRIAVAAFLARTAVIKGDFICANKFTAIGFESIYAHVKQVLSFPEPCFASFRICKIRDHRAGEPMSFRNLIGCPIQVMNTQGAFYCILPIQIILMISDFIIALLLIHRNLPKHQMKSCLMQLFNHFLWVRPIGAFRIVKVTYCKRRSVRFFLIFGTIKNVKGCFIAPCFKNQHGSRELILLQKFNLLFCFLLRIPMVCRDPRPEDPVRRKNRRPGQRHILRN